MSAERFPQLPTSAGRRHDRLQLGTALCAAVAVFLAGTYVAGSLDPVPGDTATAWFDLQELPALLILVALASIALLFIGTLLSAPAADSPPSRPPAAASPRPGAASSR